MFVAYYLQNLEGLLSMYLVTVIGRGKPQATTCQQLIADYKSRRSNPMLKCSAQHTPKNHNKIRLKEKHGKTPHVNGRATRFSCVKLIQA